MEMVTTNYIHPMCQRPQSQMKHPYLFDCHVVVNMYNTGAWTILVESRVDSSRRKARYSKVCFYKAKMITSLKITS